jgi:hypothetical protein
VNVGWDEEAPRRDLEPLGDVLESVLGRFAGTGHGSLARLQHSWVAIAGDPWHSATPVRLSEGLLTVEVRDGTAASRLRFETANLLRRIAAELGEGHVTGVRIRVAAPAGRGTADRPERPE